MTYLVDWRPAKAWAKKVVIWTAGGYGAAFSGNLLWVCFNGLVLETQIEADELIRQTGLQTEASGYEQQEPERTEVLRSM